MGISVLSVPRHLSDHRIRRPLEGDPQHCARAGVRRKLPDVRCDAGRLRARHLPRRHGTGDRGL